MNSDDESALHKLATAVTTAIKKVESEIEGMMDEADAELVESPPHIGPTPSDGLGIVLNELDPLATPLVVDNENTKDDEPPKRSSPPHT
jgi:hypothetical protein